MDIPPQYGDGYGDNTQEAEEARRVIDGDSSWKLPL